MPYQVFPASDGHLIIACGNDGQFGALTRVLGLAGMDTDPEYATNALRVEHRAALCAVIARVTATRTKADLIAAFETAGVPAGPINTVAEALDEPQITARGMRIAPEGIAGLRTPIRFSRSNMALDRAAPLLGTGEPAFGERE